MSQLTPDQELIMGRVREHAGNLATAINDASAADVPTAYLLPELITILKESGFPVPAGLGAFV